MKSFLLFLVLVLGTFSTAPAQDGNGQLFERVFRSLAHVVASENGSSLIPPSIPYDPQATNPSPQPSPTYTPVEPELSGPANWYQPPQSSAPSYSQNYQSSQPTPRPRVIQRSQGTTAADPAPGPFTNWFQPNHSPVAPSPPPQYHVAPEPIKTEPRPSPFGAVTPFRKALDPDYQPPVAHETRRYQSHRVGEKPNPQPWLFGPRNVAPEPSHQPHPRPPIYTPPKVKPPQERQKIIAVRSPFTVFQGQSNRSVIANRPVQPAPSQGTILWFKVR
ncbi:MAG: hypothetical protein AAGF67_00415 [Verrucomicrobiota bacterium]